MKWGKASSLLINPDLKLILFGGKGGSGKTTSAAATALYLNKFYPTKNILDTLSNPQKTEFVMITIPEEMGVAEMQDLSSAIAHLKIPSSHAIINMISPPTRCEFCLEKRRDQQKYIDEIAKKLRGQTIIPIPLLPHNVSGLDSLKELAEIMY